MMYDARVLAPSLRYKVYYTVMMLVYGFPL